EHADAPSAAQTNAITSGPARTVSFARARWHRSTVFIDSIMARPPSADARTHVIRSRCARTSEACAITSIAVALCCDLKRSRRIALQISTPKAPKIAERIFFERRRLAARDV